MIMKELIQITLRLDVLVQFSSPFVIDLYFTKQPTKEELIEATRHFLTDQNYSKGVGIPYMEMVQNCEVPNKDDMTENDHGVIFNSTTLIFENGL